jgi:hypothetical protein
MAALMLSRLKEVGAKRGQLKRYEKKKQVQAKRDGVVANRRNPPP